MLCYLELLEDIGTSVVEVLNFIFQLGFSTLGKAYSVDGLTPSQLQALNDLRSFGLVYRKSRDVPEYYPTRYGCVLCAICADCEHVSCVLRVCVCVCVRVCVCGLPLSFRP